MDININRNTGSSATIDDFTNTNVFMRVDSFINLDISSHACTLT